MAAFDGTSWAPLPSSGGGLGSGINVVYAMAVFNGRLYFGGDFTAFSNGTSANKLAAFDGTTWTVLRNGAASQNGVNNDVRALAVFGGRLYIGGYFTSINGGAANGAARVTSYNGATFSALPSGASNGVNNVVVALHSTNDTLLVGGYFVSLGASVGASARRVARWDGSSWSTLSGVGVGGTYVASFAMASNGALWVGGEHGTLGDNVIPTARIALYNATTTSWTRPGASSPRASGLGSNVISMTEYNGQLIVGGNFLGLADGTVASGVAAWDGAAWSPLGASWSTRGVAPQVSALAAYQGCVVWAKCGQG